jgi:hypothetical protein
MIYNKIHLLALFALSMLGAHYWGTLGPFVTTRLEMPPFLANLYLYAFHASFGISAYLISTKNIIPRNINVGLIAAGVLGVTTVSVFYSSNWFVSLFSRILLGAVAAWTYDRVFRVIYENKMHSFIPLMYSIGTFFVEGLVFSSGIFIANGLYLLVIIVPLLFILPAVLRAPPTEVPKATETASHTGTHNLEVLRYIVVNTITHCAFFILLMSLSEVYAGANAMVKIGFAVMLMAPSFSIGAMIAGFIKKASSYGIPIGLLTSVAGTYCMVGFESDTIKFLGTFLFSMGNGITISIAMQNLSRLSSPLLSYPTLSMGMNMGLTFFLSLGLTFVDTKAILLIGVAYLFTVIAFLVTSFRKGTAGIDSQLVPASVETLDSEHLPIGEPEIGQQAPNF